MPPKYVKTIRDEIFYEYSKMISKSTFGTFNHGFIGSLVKEFRSGEKTMSGTIAEFELEASLPRACIFCAADDTGLEIDHLIPSSLGGEDDSDNLVWSCGTCNSSRGNKGIYRWLGLKKKDDIPRLVAGKYLKQLFDLHETAGTLDVSRDNLEKLCNMCRLTEYCRESGTLNELTCFCLESVIR